MTTQRDTTQPAGGSPVERGVGRPVPQRHKLALECLYGSPRGWARLNEPDIGAVIWYAWRIIDGHPYGASLSFTYPELDSPPKPAKPRGLEAARDSRSVQNPNPGTRNGTGE